MQVLLKYGYLGWADASHLARQSMRRRRWERAVLVFVSVVGVLLIAGVL